MNGWILLSHILNKELFAYGNGKRITIKQIRSIENDDTSNNTAFELPTHYGTHIDFPYHFDNNGKTGQQYPPDYFISNKVQFVELNQSPITDYLITEADFADYAFIKDTEILIIKTGMSEYLNYDEYWSANPGFTPDLALFFKKEMHNLRIVGFDAISLTGRKYREIGKEAHCKFLVENDILIIEDMNLSQLTSNSIIDKIIIAPLLFEKSDGAPVTVFTKINE